MLCPSTFETKREEEVVNFAKNTYQTRRARGAGPDDSDKNSASEKRAENTKKKSNSSKGHKNSREPVPFTRCVNYVKHLYQTRTALGAGEPVPLTRFLNFVKRNVPKVRARKDDEPIPIIQFINYVKRNVPKVRARKDDEPIPIIQFINYVKRNVPKVRALKKNTTPGHSNQITRDKMESGYKSELETRQDNYESSVEQSKIRNATSNFTKKELGGGKKSEGEITSHKENNSEEAPSMQSNNTEPRSRELIQMGDTIVVDRDDIDSVRPGKEMTCEAVHAILHKIVKEFNANRNSSDSVILFHPQFAEHLLTLKKDDEMTSAEIIKQYQCFVGRRGQINRAIVPVLRKGHYVLVHYGMDAQDRVHAHIMDSLLSKDPNRYLTNAQARELGAQLFGVEMEDVIASRATEQQMPHQGPLPDCGPHTVLSVEACLRDQRFNPQIRHLSATRNPENETINQVRQRITDALEEILARGNGLPNAPSISADIDDVVDRSIKSDATTRQFKEDFDAVIVNPEDFPKQSRKREHYGHNEYKNNAADVFNLDDNDPTVTGISRATKGGQLQLEGEDFSLIEALDEQTDRRKMNKTDVAREALLRKKSLREARSIAGHKSRYMIKMETPQLGQKKENNSSSVEPTSSSDVDLSFLDYCDPELKATALSSSKREQEKLVRRIKEVVSQQLKVKKLDTPTEPSSDESYALPTTYKKRRTLSFKKKKNLVKFFTEDNRHMNWLVRRFGLSSDVRLARRQIARIRREVATGMPNRNEACNLLQERVGSMIEYRDEEEQQDIHEETFERLGMEQSICFGLKNFKASKKWVHTMKKFVNFVSRHIDARVVKPTGTRDTVAEDIKNFMSKTVPYIKKKYSPDHIYNVDQTGMKYEVTRNRTLTKKGRNKVNRVCQRKNAVSHSYTVNPCISASGKIIGKTFVTLKEGKPPRSFRQMVAPFRKLRVTNSKSGIMTSELAKDWLENSFLPNVPDNSLLLLDSWPGFDKMRKMPVLQRRKIEVIVFPKKTTSQLQPLDVSFNRQFKNFIKKFVSHIRYQEKKIIIGKRETQLHIVSLAMNQFAAPRFAGLIQRGFYKIGILDTPPPHFETPAEYCLSTQATALKLCAKCHKISFFRCAHCGIILCVACALKHLH